MTLGNYEKKGKIKNFKITKLFGKKNVNLNFEEGIKIFVGENGIGKTTILNVIYYTLKLRFKELKEIEFDSIQMEIYGSEKVVIYRDWLLHDEEYIELDRYFNRLQRYLTSDELDFLQIRIIENKEKTPKDFNEMFRDEIIRRGVPYDMIYREIRIISRNAENMKFSKAISKARNIIKNEISENIMYFPTYRRIEEDLKKLGYITPHESDLYKVAPKKVREIPNINGELIQFGMDDVQDSIDRITDEIRNSSIVGYSQITGKMITHLVHENKANNTMKDIVKKAESLNIVLDRVGDYLSVHDKNTIRNLIASNEIFDSEQTNYDPLIYFLYNLIQLYEKQSDKDNAIKNFRNACNQFLVDKEVFYDESSVKISILNKNAEKVELRNLSSGEKQIVSLFSKIYLDSSNDFLILFDEPELSLSIEWQEKLLPEVISSDKCNFMMVVTHSPFIYSNNLRDFAESIEGCIEEVQI
ncbi:AAA family ATPase [Paenibacillus lautus]|uniref:Endonuclease GajA/Old nuclease/RecF-like AAA domain-containing protein n=1 Tax=Paenibacillus lautus TaxID=1401 RepID=A0A385TID7_PAELA|nr:AAA family ATPase [Paenibacillus lautus]AYB43261.1 hypothetical protein D5F53_08170 [Paenibacillus lautus]